MRLGVRSFQEGRKGLTKDDVIRIGKQVKESNDRKYKSSLIVPLLQNRSVQPKDLVEYIPLEDLKKAGMSPRKMLNALLDLEPIQGKFKASAGKIINKNNDSKTYKKIAELYQPDELSAHGFSRDEREEIYATIKKTQKPKKENITKIKQFEVKHYL